MAEEVPKHNTFRLLGQFQAKFFAAYGVAYVLNPGRDMKLMKRVKELFEQYPGILGDLPTFIDLCFTENPTNPINTPYLLAVVNRKLGIKKKKTNKSKKPSAQLALDWSEDDALRDQGLI